MPDLAYSRTQLSIIGSLPIVSRLTVIESIKAYGLCRSHLSFKFRKTKRGSRGVARRRIPTIVSRKRSYLNSGGGVNYNNLISIELGGRCRSKSDRSELKWCLINSRFVRNKSCAISEFVVEHDLDYLFITETWLKGDVSDGPVIAELTPSGFECRNFPRLTGTGGGIAFIHKSSPIGKVTTKYPQCFPSFEWLEITVDSNQGRITYILVYRPPPSSVNNLSFNGFLSDFVDLLAIYALKTTPIIYLGDFNIHRNKPDDRDSQQFSELLKIHGLVQLVDKPTHQSGNLLDLVITREDYVSSLEVHPAFAVSDHYPIFFKLSFHQEGSVNRRKITYRSLKSFDIDNFASKSWKTIFQVDTATKLQIINTTVSQTFDKYAPFKTKTVPARAPKPWINADIFRARAERRKAERTWRRSGLAIHRQIYQSKRNEVNKLIEISRTNHFTQAISACEGDQKKLFNIVNDLFGSRRGKNVLPIHANKDDVSNVFSRFFVENIENINHKLKSNSTPVKATTICLIFLVITWNLLNQLR
ncbi:uncharacterized protein LOC117118705 [Anneissia japonica]|uniref:uncharacterized protein LOC117118705 n=1 Tax=Anneissia japonica TaxID=1529436 RepID=UPI0014255A26|nr:uncharacterized protein LOC117118705 [Anneissia japonica]